MDESPFAIDRLDGTCAVIAVDDITEPRHADLLVEVIGKLAADGCRRIVVDLTRCPLLNSKILDALVRASGEIDPREGGVAVVTDTGYVRHMLEVSAEGGVLMLAGSRDEALEALQAA